ncbi:hypothetical protein [Mariniblastus fucicola]|uniref:Lipoprotein n=1 Tax=Mariniblastus fucicola TaxID=980251 RepID=A0A5B9PCV7_9BACT|nr:hypothetical protein [Mariniblastus fucicola]QEG23349.1 hypothetical protein MFFC18_32470 [Mariniblastus fucicola]
MKSTTRTDSPAILLIAFASMLAIACGCDPKPANNQDDSRPGTHVHADGSVHNDDDNHHHEEGHAHGPGPHGGTIVDWGGGKYHAELTVDHDKQEATVFIFGNDEKTSTPIDAKEISLTVKDPLFTVSLSAKPLGSEVMGKSSRFVTTHKNFGIRKDFEGSISGVVDGTPYSGNFSEEDE